MSSSFKTAVQHVLGFCFALIVLMPPSWGQFSEKLAGKPIGIGYAKDISEVSVFDYISTLSERLNHESSMVRQAPDVEIMKSLVPEVDEQLSGQAWYLVQGMLPTFEPVNFRRVADLADAKRMLKARNQQMGGNTSKIIEEDNDCFRLVRSWSYEFEPPGQTAEEYIKTVTPRQNSGGMEVSYEAIEKDGKEMVKQTTSWNDLYRFHDNMLFNCRRDDLFEMELPAASTLTRSVERGNDLGIDVWFDRIPMGIKSLGWNLLNSTAGTMMQQKDDEEQTQADVRRNSIQLGLDVVKAIMFDVQETHGWLKWANDEDQSVRAELIFETRRNAELQKQLETAASGISRFAPVLNDEAVATVHTCITLPEAAPTFEALSAWLPVFVEQEISSDIAVTQAARKLSLTLAELAETPTLELCLKAGWSEASDGVFYGGLRVGNNEGLMDALITLLQTVNPGHIEMESVQKDGLAVLSVTIPSEGQANIEKRTGMKLSRIYLAQGASCLWFAVGSENAWQMIRQCITRCEAGGSAGRAPLFSANVDGDAWLALPQDDPTGVAGLLMYLDENEQSFPPSPLMFNFGMQDEKPTPWLQKCIDLGGDHQASFRVVADRGGLKLNAQIGEVIGNYMLIRMVDFQDRMVRSMQERQEATAAEEKSESED